MTVHSIMSLREFDTHLVSSMIALAGAGLQTQLPADFERCAQRLRDIPRNGGGAQLQCALHELRGLALAVGAEQLAELCAGVENHGANTELCTHLAEASAALATSIRSLRAATP
jgi:HPt (histidine-containing phosphotransfer) domain-containing protein